MQFQSLLKLGLILTGAALTFAGCQSTERHSDFFQQYDLENPEKFNLPENLLEVSGIAFAEGNGDTLYAVQDEDGKLFRLAWDVPKQLHTRFAKKGDYEDVAIVHGQVYILRSDGTLLAFPLSEAVKEEPAEVQQIKGLLPKGEYEGIAGVDATGELFVLCKDCEDDNAKEAVSGYTLKATADAMLTLSGGFSVNVDQVKKAAGKMPKNFRPAGLAKNPISGDWYLVSAANKLLVVTDADWQVKAAHPLDGNMFSQPEGIAFDKEGNLYISDEGDDLFSGNVLKFKKIR